MESRTHKRKRVEFFTLGILFVLLIVALFAYFDWQKSQQQFTDIVEEDPLTQEEIEERISEYVDSNVSGGDDGFVPQSSLDVNENQLYIVGSDDELTYIQGINKQDHALSQISTIIDEKRLTSVDMHMGTKLLAFTSAEHESLVSGLFITDTQSFNKRVLKENILGKRTFSNAQFSPDGSYLSYFVQEEESQRAEIFSLERNEFKKIELEEGSGKITFIEWTNQGKILLVTQENKVFISKDAQQPEKMITFSIDLPEGTIRSISKSPTENLFYAIMEEEREDAAPITLFVYNIDTGIELAAIRYGDDQFNAVWSVDGRYIFVSQAGNMYTHMRDDAFKSLKEPTLSGVGVVEQHMGGEYLAFRKDFYGGDEVLHRIDLWSIGESQKIFSSDPLPFVDTF